MRTHTHTQTHTRHTCNMNTAHAQTNGSIKGPAFLEGMHIFCCLSCQSFNQRSYFFVEKWHSHGSHSENNINTKLEDLIWSWSTRSMWREWLSVCTTSNISWKTVNWTKLQPFLCLLMLITVATTTHFESDRLQKLIGSRCTCYDYFAHISFNICSVAHTIFC